MSTEHFNDQCPQVKDVNLANGFRRYEPPSSNFYNPSWKDHPNLKWGSQGPRQAYPSNPSSSTSMNLEDILTKNKNKNLTFQQTMQHFKKYTLTFQQETRARISSLTSQMSQLASM